METNDLIKNLASNTKTIKPLRTPANWIAILSGFGFFYYILIQLFLGVRSDFSEKILQPIFITEIFLLLLLFFSCISSAALMIYPDSYQKPQLLKAPYFVVIILIFFFGAEVFEQSSNNTLILDHGLKCTLCIASLTIVPSLYFFYIIRKGANINPLKSGFFSVSAASAISAIALRMHEQQDAILHLLTWHYLPILLFSTIGSLIGRIIFKW